MGSIQCRLKTHTRKTQFCPHSQLEGALGDRRNMTANINAFAAVFAENVNVEQAAALHFGPLLAHEARA